MKRLFKFSGLRIYILVLLVLIVCIVSVLLVFKKGPQKNTDAFIEESKKDVATNTHIHEWSEWKEIKGRFCTDGSDWTRKCNSCNETEKSLQPCGDTEYEYPDFRLYGSLGRLIGATCKNRYLDYMGTAGQRQELFCYAACEVPVQV